MATVETNLGRVTFVAEGIFDPNKTDYKRLGVVVLDGSSYQATVDNPTGMPQLDGSNPDWQLIAKKGDDGEPGTQGPKGDGLHFDATGPIADRGDYDSEAPGFVYLADDEGKFYVRLDPTGWSIGQSISGELQTLSQPSIGQIAISSGNTINLNTVNMSGNQTGIAGNKTWNGNQQFINEIGGSSFYIQNRTRLEGDLPYGGDSRSYGLILDGVNSGSSASYSHPGILQYFLRNSTNTNFLTFHHVRIGNNPADSKPMFTFGGSFQIVGSGGNHVPRFVAWHAGISSETNSMRLAPNGTLGINFTGGSATVPDQTVSLDVSNTTNNGGGGGLVRFRAYGGSGVRLMQVDNDGYLSAAPSLSGTGNGIVGVNAGGTLTRRPESDVIQTLSLGTGAGNIAISGGNNVSLLSLGRPIISDVPFATWANKTGGLYTFIADGTVTGLPISESGSGIFVKHVTNATANTAGSFAIYKPYVAGSDKLIYLYGNTVNGGTYESRTFASEEWANAQGWLKSADIGDGTLTLATGTGLTGSASFTANQSTPSTFTVGVDAGYKLPTTAEWGAKADTSSLATVATSGSYDDLIDKPSTFTPSPHTHNASDINAGVLDILRIPTGTTASTVAIGNHTHTFASITSKPTTLSGYGITDALPLTGGTVTGAISWSGVPSNDNHLANKKYVDDSISGLGAGTVTSVGVSVPTGFSVTGSPVTSNGTIAITYATGYQGYTTAEASKLAGIEANANNYTLPTATKTTLGGVKLFSNTVQSVASNVVTSTSDRTYGVQLNSAGEMVVNVPWTDTVTTGLAWSAISSTPTTLSGYGITDAYTKTESDSLYLTSQKYKSVIPVSANRTIALTDEDCLWVVSGDRTLTVPTNASVAFPIGGRIDVQVNAEATADIEGAAGVTLTHKDGTGDTSREGFTMFTFIKTSTNAWTIVGG